MIDIWSNYDHMHKNEIFYALICINSHIITNINFMLSPTPMHTHGSKGEMESSSKFIIDA